VVMKGFRPGAARVIDLPDGSTTLKGLSAFRFFCISWLVFTGPVMAQPGELHSYARVLDDGSLEIRGHIVRLHGIHIPETERQCRGWSSPVRCADRGVLQLDFKIQGFVHCYTVGVFADGSLDGVCYVGRSSQKEGEDLAAWMVRNGWAMALPDAPFEYVALERIARQRGLGVWGIPVDSVRIR